MTKIRPGLLACLLVPLGFGLGPGTDGPPPPFAGRVVAAADGDTITVLRPDRTAVKIRLHGIDAPESGQDFGDRTRRRLVDLAVGRDVRVEPVERDRYGRTVARVRIDGVDIGESQVRDGLAWWYRKYAPTDAALERAEAAARKARRGLWSSSAPPVPPWEWRSGTALPSELAGRFVASKRSKVYHAPGCRAIVRIAPGNRLTYDSAEAARRSGRRPAGDCR